MKLILKTDAWRNLVKRWLGKFPFVQWDRFVYVDDGPRIGICAYGWIDRKNDAYKDFFCLDIYTNGEVLYITSSKKYSLQICKIITGGDGKGHTNCKRIEDHFDIPNCIKL